MHHFDEEEEQSFKEPPMTSLSVREFEEMVDQLVSGQKSFSYCLFVWGSPGIGKTESLQRLLKKKGLTMTTIMLSQMEPADLKGLPVVDHENKQVVYLKDELFPRDPNTRGVLFFDEMTTASIEVTQAALRLIHERRLDDVELPPGMLIIAAGNQRADQAFVNPISSALANRFLHIKLEPRLSEWVEWAVEEGVMPEIISFVQAEPHLLHDMSGDVEQGWPSPRSWVQLHHLLSDLGGPQELSPRLLLSLCQGAVGLKAGRLFVDYLETKRFWMSPQQFFEQAELPLLVKDNRPELRLRLLTEMSQALSKKLNEGVDEVCQLWVSGLFHRLTQLNETEAVMMIRAIAHETTKSSHHHITGHAHFGDLLERVGLEAVSSLALTGKQLVKFVDRGHLSERGAAMLNELFQITSTLEHAQSTDEGASEVEL